MTASPSPYPTTSFAMTALRLTLFALVTLAIAPEILEQPRGMVDFHDEFFFYSHEESARRTMVGYGELPFWNPYLCGGVPGIGNPQDSSLAPDFALRLIFGTSVGRHLAVLLFFVLAMEGLFRLARRHRAGVVAAAAGAVVFGMSGRMENAFEHGHLNLMLNGLLPWALLFYERALGERRYVTHGALVIAWMVLCGGTYTAPYAAQLLLVATVYWSARLAFTRRDADPSKASPLTPWIVLAAIGGLAVLLSAVRLFPVAEVVFGIPRELPGRQVFEPGPLLGALFSPSGAGTEGDAYVGVAVAALAAFALFAGDRSGRWFAGGALFFFVLALGEQTPYAPYALFRKLPVFSQLRDPYRYSVLVGMFLSLGAARGLTVLGEGPRRALSRWLERRNRAPLGPWTKGALSAVGLVATLATVRLAAPSWLESQEIQVGSLFVEPPVSGSWQRFRQSRGNRWDSYVWPSVNLGSLHCFEETKFPMAVGLRGDLRAEEYPLDPDAASVRRTQWSPHHITLEVDASEATRVVINQNYHRSWGASVGEVVSHEGLLAVDVPAGQHTLVLSFVSGAGLTGLAVSLLSAFALLGLFGRRVRRRWLAWRARWRSLPP